MQWPSLNTLAWLHLPCCADEHPTRIEDSNDDVITVAAPMLPHDALVHPFAGDDVFILGWTAERGSVETPVSLVEHTLEPVPLWALKPVGEPVETQRRNFVRLPVNIAVRVHFNENSPATEVFTTDLSEGGLRCEVDKWVLDPHERTFLVEVPIEDDTLYLNGTVAWWGTMNADGLRTVGIRFANVEEKVGDRIRRFVFAKQTEQRRRQ